MKLEEMQQHYQHYQSQLFTVEKYKKQQATLQAQIEHAEGDIARYEQQLALERQNLNKMEKFSFVNTFRTWTGKQQELREQRFDQIAAIELKLIEAQMMAEDLRDDLIDNTYKINAINEGYATEQMRELARQIEQYIMNNIPQIAEKLQDNLHQHTLVEQLLIEIEEAIYAGQDAEIALENAAKILKDAKMYSTWDTFLGGGFIATYIKHDKLDSSKSYLHEAQLALQRFHNELLDIQEMRTDTLQIDTDGFIKFADYFFDDIFSEWSVHSKISTSLNQISRVLDDVRNTMRAVKQKQFIAKEKKQDLLSQRTELLTTGSQTL